CCLDRIRRTDRHHVALAGLLDAELGRQVPDSTFVDVGRLDELDGPLLDEAHGIERGLQGPWGAVDGTLLKAAHHHGSRVEMKLRYGDIASLLDLHPRDGDGELPVCRVPGEIGLHAAEAVLLGYLGDERVDHLDDERALTRPCLD